MEIVILSFVGGIAVAMIIAAVADRMINILLFLSLPVFVICLWYFWATHGIQYFFKKISRNDPSLQEPSALLPALGQTGDLFGGINALFAALAFAGVAVAAIMQARSLQLAREQQLQQSFEPLFFHLLELHRGVSAPKFKLRSRFSAKGKSVLSPDGLEQAVDFSRAISVLRRVLRLKAFGFKKQTNRGSLLSAECARYYKTFYDQNQDELGPHFRTLFHIFKLIDASNFTLKNKVKYANIARATLGRDQLFLLAVNCLSHYGANFKPFVEKYGLLKHIADNDESINIDQCVASWCYHANAQRGAKDRIT